MDVFFICIGNGNLLKLDEIIRSGFDPSTNYNIAIQVAYCNGHLGIVERLLQCEGVDPTINDNYPIRLASYYGHLKVVDRLLMDKRVVKTGNFTPGIIEIIKSKIIESTKIYVILKGRNFYNKTKIPDELIPLIMDFVCIKYYNY
jgi:hypothetical protein